MAEQKITRSRALELLKEKQEELNRLGEDRYPKLSDFSDAQVVAIKAFFGPWPRALEAAGIKPPRGDDRLERNREKRIRAKRACTEAKKAQERSKKQEDTLFE